MDTVWRPREDITADLSSGDPERVTAGIRDLEAQLGFPGELSLAPDAATSIVSAIDDRIPIETRLTVLRILTRSNAFDPPLSPKAQRDALIEILLAGGESRLALEISFVFKGADDPDAVVGDVVAQLGRRDLISSRAVEGAKWFVSYLLAGTAEVRAATLAALRAWPGDAGHDEVVDFIFPELDPEERVVLRGQ